LKISDGGKPSGFLKSLAEQKVPAFALTDHGNMYGAMDFYFAASSLGIKPIIGCELYMAPGPRTAKSGTKRRDNGHLTVLAKDMDGYHNLMELTSRGFTEGFYHDPRIDFELLEKYKKGLIVLSGCLKGHVTRECAAGNIEEAAKIAGKYSDILGKDNFYLEIMDHGIPEEQVAMKNLIEVAKQTNLPLVATNDCHYQNKDDWEAHDAHICISTRSVLSDPNRMKMTTNELYYKSPEEMIKLFSHTPESIKNTMLIAERCNVKIETGVFHLPKFKQPVKFKDDAECLEQYCIEGLKKKLGRIGPDYKKRLDYELSVIKKMGFSSYFLIVMDFIDHAREVGNPVGPGRGSGAGSLVAFSLDITRVDPLVHGLLFERFLNPDRNSMPDLDIDFSGEGRAEVIEYVRRKYGENNVASIITYGTLKAKAAIKDVGRVMDIPLEEVSKITKMFSDQNATLYQLMNENEEVKKELKDPKIKKLFEIARKIEGLKRHVGVHAAGVVITNKPVVHYTPVANRNTKNIVTTQYDGGMLDKLGLLKVDFLGLRTLSVIDMASKIIKKKKTDFDIYKIPLDDKNTFALLSSGNTAGIFQLESEGMKELIRGLKPSLFSDISALVALYRPGPIQSGMLVQFVERKHGRKKIVYDHHLLETVLKDTYGTIVYQEQVMGIAKTMGGFSGGEADFLRKAMGKKNFEVMEKYKQQFIDGAKKRDVPPKIADKIFEQMLQFAAYGFNKSHSVAYALIAYQTAYLKANYPLEFMSSLLTSEIGKSAIDSDDKENKLVTYVEEAENMNIKVFGPNVNYSYTHFSIEHYKDAPPAIRFALNAVKNVGEGIVEMLIAERKENGKFTSLDNFISRLKDRKFNKRVGESLAKSGALDCFADGDIKEVFRAKVLNNLDELFSGKGKSKKEDANQNMLFGFEVMEKKTLLNDEVEPLSEHALLKNEKEVLGFYLSGHPLASLKRPMNMLVSSRIAPIVKGQMAVA
ncbi:MAG: DNA polymerase III subunit alpha, partial [Elusimicrobiota bacterium]|nr:DNA polymerase III subunit alpha [Elusimicrobiota bacterium]